MCTKFPDFFIWTRRVWVSENWVTDSLGSIHQRSYYSIIEGKRIIDEENL